jgi:hypothetical protein
MPPSYAVGSGRATLAVVLDAAMDETTLFLELAIN